MQFLFLFESFSLKNLLDYMYKMSKDNSVIIIRLLDFIFRMIDYYNSYKQKNISINEENEINLKTFEIVSILEKYFGDKNRFLWKARIRELIPQFIH